MKRHLPYCLGLILIASVLEFVGSARTGYQGTDELRYAQISKELGPGRDFFLLHFNGVRYTDKPPLYFWSVALAYKLLGGPSPFALRVPGQLSSIASLILIYGLTFMLFRRRGLAFAAAALLLIMPRYLWIGRWGRLDVPMCLSVYAALTCFARSYFVTKTRLAGWWFWIFLGLSLAIKGPAGPVVILGTAVTFLWLQGELNRWRELFHWKGIAAAIALNLIWAGPMLVLGEKVASQDVLVDQTFQRIFHPSRHVKPPWYYLGEIWQGGFPAMLFAFGGGLYWLKNRRRGAVSAGGPPSGLFGEDHAACRFLLAWWGFTLVFFSIYPPKRSQYLLPSYPAVAIFTVYFLDTMAARFNRKPSPPRLGAGYFTVPAYLTLIAVSLLALVFVWRVELAGAAVKFLEPRDIERAVELREANEGFDYGAYRFDRTIQIAATVALLAFVAVGGLLVRRRMIAPSFGLMMAMQYGALIFFFAAVAPPALLNSDMKASAAEIGALIAKQPDLAVMEFGDNKPYYNIYSDFIITYFDRREKEEFLEYLARIQKTRRPYLVILEEDRMRKLNREPMLRGLEREERTMRGDKIYFLKSAGVGDPDPSP